MPSGPIVPQHVQLCLPGSGGAAVGQVDDLTLALPLDSGVWHIDEARQTFGQPVIPARLPALAVHSLLHHHPMTVVGNDEAVQVKVEAVLHRRAIDLGDQPTGVGKCTAIEPDPFANRDQLVRGLPRMPAAAAADVDAKLARERCETAFQRADDARRDPRGMPIHAHDGAERLEPEGVGKPTQQFVAAVVMHDGLADHAPRGASCGPPAISARGRRAAADQRCRPCVTSVYLQRSSPGLSGTDVLCKFSCYACRAAAASDRVHSHVWAGQARNRRIGNQDRFPDSTGVPDAEFRAEFIFNQ